MANPELTRPSIAFIPHGRVAGWMEAELRNALVEDLDS